MYAYKTLWLLYWRTTIGWMDINTSRSALLHAYDVIAQYFRVSGPVHIIERYNSVRSKRKCTNFSYGKISLNNQWQLNPSKRTLDCALMVSCFFQSNPWKYSWKLSWKRKKKDNTYAFITQSPLMHNNKTTHKKDRNRAKTVVIHLKLTIRPENYGNIVFIQK